MELVEEWAGFLRQELELMQEGAWSAEQAERLSNGFWAYLGAYVKGVSAEEGAVCGKGCAHCCSHYPSSLEPFELFHIYGGLRKRADFQSKMAVLWQRSLAFEGHYKRALLNLGEEDADDQALADYFAEGEMCPFLETSGACGIYELRPGACRMYFSRKNPHACAPELFDTAENGNYLIELPEEIEVLLAALARDFEALELPDALFRGLISLNAEEGEWDLEEFYKSVE